MRREVIGFLIVGGIAFFIDTGILQLLTFVGMDPYLARAVSFTLALTFTWWMNRNHSFKVSSKPTWKEFFAYASSVSFGGAINWLVYIFVLELYLTNSDYPAIALVPATAISMCFNFLVMKFVVFRKRTDISK
ncbi:GtrA family protein [Curvivirga sp.]|uniref:GtrA family protein n=1 Tax=Curvivirga sp. TaxID=2856848 RepID=UPI003B5AA0B0